MYLHNFTFLGFGLNPFLQQVSGRLIIRRELNCTWIVKLFKTAVVIHCSFRISFNPFYYVQMKNFMKQFMLLTYNAPGLKNTTLEQSPVDTI